MSSQKAQKYGFRLFLAHDDFLTCWGERDAYFHKKIEIIIYKKKHIIMTFRKKCFNKLCFMVFVCVQKMIFLKVGLISESHFINKIEASKAENTKLHFNKHRFL